jgi:hypothetical protein
MEERKLYPPPSTGTNSSDLYFKDIKSSIELFTFVLDSILFGDYASSVAKQAIEGHKDSSINSPRDLARLSPGPRTLNIRKNSQLYLELFMARLVDSFQCYIVSIIREVLSVQPRVLMNAQPTLSLEYIFQFNNYEELTSDIVESKVIDLSYQGFQKLKQWCTERGIPIVVATKLENNLIELISLRNIIAHNRGIIDKKYLSIVQESKYKLGAHREIKVEELFESVSLLNRVVAETDAEIQIKFGLPTHNISQ